MNSIPTSDEFLSDVWYFAVSGKQLRSGKTCSKTIAGQPILFGRDWQGTVFAVHAICPHRGMPLKHGRFDGEHLECAYHGWRFATNGVCQEIPCLVAQQARAVDRIKLKHYPCREVQGNVWVYIGDESRGLPPVYSLPAVADLPVRISLSMRLQCDIDTAALGLLDPAHTPYVHHSPIWRSPNKRRAKQKSFAPHAQGFKMLKHAMSSNSTAYKILGANPEVEIDFQLPGLRIESIQAGANAFCGLTTVTPIDAHSSEINHQMYWNIAWLTALRPLLKPITRYFLNQDRVAMLKLSEGLPYHARNLYVHDPDAQAKWYFALKTAWQHAQESGAEFVNPVEAAVLEWRT